jgi:hypothetical protein
MLAKGAGYVYVAGRIRDRDEMNGKSGNLNNVLGQLYGNLPIPGNEILCVLDADMVPSTSPAPSVMLCGRCSLPMYKSNLHDYDHECLLHSLIRQHHMPM